MAVNSYDYGDLVRTSAVFTDIFGVLQDPDQVLIQVRAPDKTIIEYEYLVDVTVVRDSAGNYHFDVDCNAAGIWWYRWYSTGEGQAADEDYFKVRPSQFS